MSVKIVTDSTADLPTELVQKLDIAVVPLCIKFGTDVYRDGVDLQPEEFYRRLVSSPVLPTTSVPSPDSFTEAYRNANRACDGIVSIHLSCKLSSTCECALLAAREINDKRVEVIDSQTVSMALGLLVIAAAQAAQGGASLKEVTSLVKGASSRCHLIGVLNTLEYLHKGGRIGHAQALLGNMLNVKPLLEVRHGEVHPLDRVRTRKRALNRLCELALKLQPFENIAVLHSVAPQEAELLAGQLASGFPGKRICRSSFGPVLGTYVGPGAVGIAILQQSPKGSNNA